MQRLDQVAPDRAADAAVVHLEQLLVRVQDEVVVDADLAELVDDHRIATAVVLGEDAVQKRGLAGAEIAGQHGDGDEGAFVSWRGFYGLCARLRNPTGGLEVFQAIDQKDNFRFQ